MTLIGYWPLNETSGSTAYDHSGDENHGTINDGGDSTLTGATGLLGQNCYVFDGSNDYVNLQSNSFLGGVRDFTFSAWVYLESLGSLDNPYDGGLSGDNGTIILSKVGSEDDSIALGVNKNSDIFAHFDDNSGGKTQIAGGNVSTSEWIHVVVRRNLNKSKAEIIIDNSTVASSSNPSTALNDTTNPVEIGGISGRGNGPNGFFDGRIAEMRIYDHPLTDSEIHYLYQVSQRGRQVTSSKTS